MSYIHSFGQVNPDTLVSIFGVYGDVVKVKMLSDRASALVQMDTVAQAAAVMQLLDGIPLARSALTIQQSHQQAVNDRKVR
jgi:hypothetical protein